MQHLDHTPLVSVVIATYNMGEYLPKAISSILEGSYPNVEVIVVDDGSTDETKEVVGAFSEEARVKYISQQNMGQPKAKNRGLREVRGEFIAFCDADDFWEPNKLSTQMPKFEDPEVGVVYSEVSYVDGEGRRYHKKAPYHRYSGRVVEQLLLKNFVPFGTVVMRKACVSDLGGFDESFKMGIDWDLWLRYSLHWKFVYVDQPTYVYREWSGQMSNNHRGRYEHAFAILERFESRFGDRVSKQALDRAWADNYVSRGLLYAKKEKKIMSPLADVLMGIRKSPTYLYAWKAFVKIILRRF